jgi:hypothetical protein
MTRSRILIAMAAVGVAAGNAWAEFPKVVHTPSRILEFQKEFDVEIPEVAVADPEPAAQPSRPTPKRVEILADDSARAPVTVVAFPQPGRGYESPNVWLETSVLSWKIKNGPLAFPLLTTGSVTDPAPGALLQPGTKVIFGGNGIDYGRCDGLRLTLGGWLGDEPIGGEVSGFALRQQQVTLGAMADASGFPPLYLPAFNAITMTEAALLVADPLAGFTGSATIVSQSQVWGWEANGLLAATRSSWFDLDFLAGFRMIELDESLDLINPTTDLALGTLTNLRDRFAAENRFCGGQVGARATFHCGKFFAEATGKVGYGATRSHVDVEGAVVQAAAPPLPSGTFPGGFFTQPTNIGGRTETNGAMLCEANLRAGCDLFGCLRIFVGYDCLQLNRVARPGDQIDRVLNLTQSPVFGGGILVGPPRPAPMFTTTDFFVQGVSAGIELRY